MTTKDYKVRFANTQDKLKIFSLYKQVAKKIGGIARIESEITEEYIYNNLHNSLRKGICLVIDSINTNEIIAEIHCYKLEPLVFNHILSELTIVVHPNYQQKGLGKLLFKSLLHHIENHLFEILRVELIARESNQKAIAFYKNLGFRIEGRFEKRITNSVMNFEADIPMAWFNKNFKKQ